MIQVAGGVCEELTYFQFECSISAGEYRQNIVYVLSVLTRGFTEYDYIIDLDESRLRSNTRRNSVH